MSQLLACDDVIHHHPLMRHLLCLLLIALTARAELKTDIEFAKPGGVSLTLDALNRGASRKQIPINLGRGPLLPICLVVPRRPDKSDV